MNTEYHIIGLMSGTSLDGLDIVKCIFKKEKKWSYIVEKSETIEYSVFWEEKLKNLHKKDKKEITKCGIEYGKYLGVKVNEFLMKNNLKTDYISSHGHTIFHDPENQYTLQIGDGANILNTTNITTINNFRKLDISLFGEGAPLVPIGDLHLFTKYKYCLNLGGFANISEKKTENNIIAFDICSVNFVLNILSNKLGHKYDNKGKISKGGWINELLLDQLNNLDFFKKKAAKSLGREWVETDILPILEKTTISIQDKMRTFTEHIAIQIGKYLRNKSVLVTGGGVYNDFLIERIKYYSNSEIIIPKTETIDFKEAIIFAFLGVLKLRNENNCLSSVTSAIRDCSGGEIFKK
jgi:anhydro-N-acetylmuramic acid kinase